MVTENTEPLEDGAAPQGTSAESTESTPRTFTQEDVNRLTGQARRDARSQFSDYDALKERAARADELEQAQLSEAEKMSQRATTAEAQVAEANARTADALIASEVKVRAVQLGVVDPDAAYLLMDRSSVKYDPDSGVSGVDDALTQLLDDKPYLKGAAARTPNINPESGQPAPVTRLSADQQEAARLMGMTDEEYSQGL
jgi:phage I-like protein